MKTLALRGEGTACEFRSAHDVTLWPLELAEARFFSYAPDLPVSRLPLRAAAKGGVRLRLKTTAGLKFSQLALERLVLHITGGDEIAYKLHELMLGHTVGVLAAPVEKPMPWYHFLQPDQLCPFGFDDEQALLPVSAQGFQGYRLLQEYFAFPQRFLFVELRGLAPTVRRLTADELELVIFFGRSEPQLEGVVDASNFALHCVPAVNLFPHRADRIHVSDADHEYHVVPDRTRPLDFEVYEVTTVSGHGDSIETPQRDFLPFYKACHPEERLEQAYFTQQRLPRLLSSAQKQIGTRTSYIGSEVFISIVDAEEAPYAETLRQLAVETLCTNRDLPLLMPLGAGTTDFVLHTAAPLEAIRCIKGPSRPLSPPLDGETPWRFISHLSLNYLSLLDSGGREAAAALRELLQLYGTLGDGSAAPQVEGLQRVAVSPVVRHLPLPGPIAVGRGLEILLELDELAFQGNSAFLFSAVMERFFARHVSMNSFTQTVLRSGARGEIMRWPPRIGTRAVL
jgi:type VI secretion system protein ImpG